MFKRWDEISSWGHLIVGIDHCLPVTASKPCSAYRGSSQSTLEYLVKCCGRSGRGNPLRDERPEFFSAISNAKESITCCIQTKSLRIQVAITECVTIGSNCQAHSPWLKLRIVSFDETKVVEWAATKLGWWSWELKHSKCCIKNGPRKAFLQPSMAPSVSHG